MRTLRDVLVATGAAAWLMAAAPLAAQDAPKPTGGWISVSGTVQSVGEDSFAVKYGDGKLTVGVADYQWAGSGPVEKGARVTVSGWIDEAFYEEQKIRATSVYVDGVNEYYFANPIDEQGGYYAYPMSQFPDDEWVTLIGTVKQAGEDELTIDVGSEEILVKTSAVKLPPEVDVGDRVSVYSPMEGADIFRGREVNASSVVVLSQSGSG